MSQADSKTDLPTSEATFVAHLLELRDRLLRIVIVVGILFMAMFPFANDLYTFLASPLLIHMPSGSSMIAVEVISPFLTPLKMTLFAAIILGMPYLLYQIWSFVAPGLYKHEKRLAVPLLISSVILFYCGMAFAYFVVFPLVFTFLIGVAPEGVAMMTDISKYLDFILAMFFAFGLAFEVPVATIILIATGLTTAEDLTDKRPYIIVGAFVIGMLLTPPDVISQIMLAVPMWILFELGIIMSRVLIQPREDEDEDGNIIETEDVTPSPVAATSTGSDASASAENQESTSPTGYSTSAYPDDYEPLSEDELEAELEAASEWDGDDDWEDDDDEDKADDNSKDDADKKT